MSTDNEEVQARIVEIPGSVTVGQLAELLEVSITDLIAELFRSGIMVTVNDKVDFDTAQIITSELGLDVELQVAEEKDDKKQQHQDESNARATSNTAKSRPPIIAVMGHVDHGKTTLLDAVSGKKVAEGEAGGITQHISAFQVDHNGRLATFLDTPGHEAFSAIREHGAKLTDLVLLVVAADDGVKPQTEEAIKYASRAGVDIMVAINKIDKEGADLNRAKQQLSDIGLQPEEWGGKTVYSEVSALKNDGIDNMLDMIFLATDVHEKKSDFGGMVSGLVIEAYMDKGKGPVAKILIEHGTLRKGDFLSSGGTYASVRVMEDSFGNEVMMAGPASPVAIYGFKELPRFGDIVVQHKTIKEAKKAAKAGAADIGSARSKMVTTNTDLLDLIASKTEVKEVPIIIKADAQGSLKSAVDAVREVENSRIRPRVISYGVGPINDGDILFAQAAGGALILGFNVGAANTQKTLASTNGVTIEEFDVIYNMVDYVKEYMNSQIEVQQERKVKAKIDIQGVFHSTKNNLVCGGKVVEGEVTPGNLVDFFREEEKVATGEITSVKKQSQEVKSASAGDMCGIKIASGDGKLSVKVGDVAEVYQIITVKEEIK